MAHLMMVLKVINYELLTEYLSSKFYDLLGNFEETTCKAQRLHGGI